MRIIEDLGMQYAKPSSKNRFHFAVYECPFCGQHFRTSTVSVNKKLTKSCGCMKSKFISDSIRTHGDSDNRLNSIWGNIKQRCYNKNNPCYKSYGGKGISVCEEWKRDYIVFRNWALSHGYRDDLTIDRKDGRKNYCPENCQWITFYENRKKHVWHSLNTSGYKGVTKYLNKWVSRIQVDGTRIYLGVFADKISAACAYNDYAITNNLDRELNKIG